MYWVSKLRDKMKKIMPPTYFLIFLILSVLLHFIFPIKKIIFYPGSQVGWIFIVFGAVLNIWADQIFKKEKTTVKPGKTSKKLIEKGPFKISRHPMYLGMTSILLGTALIHGSLVGFIFPIIFIILMEISFIPSEEKNMEKVFVKKYFSYKNKVRRWI